MTDNNTFRKTNILVFIIILFIVQACKKPENPISQPTTVTDIDGMVYNTVKIGTQVWLKENLKVTKFRNGDLIGTTNPPNLNIGELNTTPYQWPYDGNESNVEIYGRLYTWYAATDIRGVCPVGWHLPSDSEWTTLKNYLIANGYNYDGTVTGQNEAKALATDYGWSISTNNGAVGNTDFPAYRNKSRFSALPGGYREYIGVYKELGSCGYWWSSDQFGSNEAFYRVICSGATYSAKNGHWKSYAISIRCIWDN